MIITHKINMDLTRRGMTPRIPMMQGDILTRKVEISLLCNGLPWQIPGSPRVLIRYRRPDQTAGAYDTLAGGTPAYSLKGNVVTIAVSPDALTLPGDVFLIVSLVSGEQVLSTFEITLEVQPNYGAEVTAEEGHSFISGVLPGLENAQEGQILAVDKVTETGTVQSLKAIDLPEGKSAYEYAQDAGYTGTEAEFAEMLAQGNYDLPIGGNELGGVKNGGTVYINEDGTMDAPEIKLRSFQGTDGRDGVSISISQKTGESQFTVETVSLYNGEAGANGKDGVDGKDGENGKDGADGKDGAAGKSAYAYAQEGGYAGTEAEFAEKLAAEYPTALPNPKKLILVGAVNAEYDGSGTVTVDIPAGGEANTETVLSDNLFDKSTVTAGQLFYHSSTGPVLTASTDVCYAYVPLRGAGTYRTKVNYQEHQTYANRVPILTEDKTFIQNVTGTVTETDDKYAADLEFTITQDMVDNGAALFAFDCHTTILSTVMIVKDREYPSSYIPYGYIEVATDSGLKQNNVLCGKTAVFLGDSICAGTTVDADSGYYNYGWAGIIGQANLMNWKNYGLNGGTVTSLAAVAESRWLTSQADNAISEYPDADYVIFEGGCNDADQMQAAGLGVISSDYATFDTSTFSGAFEALILKLVTAYPHSKIGYIIPQKMYDGKIDYTAANHIHRRYFDRAVEICAKWGIPVIDLWNGSSLNPKLSNADLFYTDGQHLTLAGYQKLVPMIESWMRVMHTPGMIACSGGSGGSAGVSSWNDLTDKPFNIETLMPATQFQYNEDSEMYIAESDFEFMSGRTYLVTWNGTEYIVSAKTFYMEGSIMIGVGNDSFIGGEDNGLPFVIVRVPYDPTGKGLIAAIPMDGSTSVTISVKGSESTALYRHMDSVGPLNLDIRIDSETNSMVAYATKEQLFNAYTAGRSITALMLELVDDTTSNFIQYIVWKVEADGQRIFLCSHNSSIAPITMQYSGDGIYVSE